MKFDKIPKALFHKSRECGGNSLCGALPCHVDDEEKNDDSNTFSKKVWSIKEVIICGILLLYCGHLTVMMKNNILI